MFWSRKKPTEPDPVVAASAPKPEVTEATSPASSAFITGDSSVDRRSIDVLLGAIARISAAQDLETKLVDIVDRSIEITGAERGLLILADAQGHTSVRVARSRDGQNLTEGLRFSTTLVKRVLVENQAVKATVQADAERVDLGQSFHDLKLRAVMCVPLRALRAPADGVEAAQRGVLYIDSRAATREFTHRDLALFAALSQHISIALDNERLHEHMLARIRLDHLLELASAIQNALMPRTPKDLTGFELSGWYRAAERTSGDFYDFVRLRDDRLALIVGDVSGHGIGPALITAAAQAALRSFLKVGSEPAAALTLLNQDLCERIESGMFLTLLLLVLASDGHCEVLNAGHHGPLVWRARKRDVESVAAHGPALGWMAETAYSVDASLALHSGDVLVAYTDGLTEAHAAGQRERLFGEERVRVLLAELAEKGRGAEEIARSLAEAALSFSGQTHEDDITLVVVKKL